MAGQKNNGLVIYNTLIICTTILEGIILGYLFPSLQLLSNPLLVTRICAVTLALQNCLSIYLLQGTYYIKKWQLAKGSIIFLLSSLFFHILTVLYGAPLFESAAETYHFACLLVTVTVLPSCVALGINSHAWIRVYSLSRPESAVEACVQITTLCSFIGAWLGAFPIPLDWDRPWQEWPITCVVGTLTGNTLGHLWSSYTASSKSHSLPKSKLG